MSRRFLSSLRLPRSASAPTGGSDGDVVLSGNVLYGNNAGTWSVLNVQYQNAASAATRPKIWTGTASTDSSGVATFTFPTGYFTTLHVANSTVSRTDNTLTGSFVKSMSASQVQVQTYVSNLILTILVGGSPGLVAGGAGITVMLSANGI